MASKSGIWATVIIAVVVLITLLVIGGIILYFMLTPDKEKNVPEENVPKDYRKEVSPPNVQIPALPGFECLEGDYKYPITDTVNDQTGNYAPLISKVKDSKYEYYLPTKDTRINIVVDNQTDKTFEIYGEAVDPTSTTNTGEISRVRMTFPANKITSLKEMVPSSTSTNPYYAVYRNQLLYYGIKGTTTTNVPLTNNVPIDGTKYYMLVRVTMNDLNQPVVKISYCI